jgi:hypothetical protein
VQVVVVYVVAIPVSGFSVDADAPLIVFHTLFAATIGLSVAWLRSKGLKLSKRYRPNHFIPLVSCGMVGCVRGVLALIGRDAVPLPPG